MNLSLTTLANSFYFAAALSGVPSVSATVLVIIYRLHALIAPEPAKFANVKNPDAILLMLGGLAGFIEKIASAFSFLGRYVMTALAIISVAGLLFSAALYLTGRGLHAHREWAVTAASVMVGVILLVATFSVLASRGLFRVFAISLVAASVCALVTLRRDAKVSTAVRQVMIP